MASPSRMLVGVLVLGAIVLVGVTLVLQRQSDVLTASLDEVEGFEVGSTWVLVEAVSGGDHIPIPDSSVPTMERTGDGVGGFGGCNDYSTMRMDNAADQSDGPHPALHDVATEAMLCPDGEVMAVEEAVTDGFWQAIEVDVVDDVLVIRSPTTTLRWAPASPASPGPVPGDSEAGPGTSRPSPRATPTSVGWRPTSSPSVPEWTPVRQGAPRA